MVPGNKKNKIKKVVLKEEWSQVVYLEIIQTRFQKEKEKRKRKEKNDTPFHVQIVKVLGEEEKGFIKKKLSEKRSVETHKEVSEIFFKKMIKVVLKEELIKKMIKVVLKEELIKN